MSDTSDREEPADGAEQPIEKAFRERLRSVKSVTERRTLAGLAREIGKLPVDVARAALETSASIAGVSLRASVEFLRAAPDASRVLETEELRAWGESMLADDELLRQWFRSGRVRQLWNAHQGGEDHSARLWRVVVIMQWLRSRAGSAPSR